ncbi:hypothetical protein Sbal183_3938 [Shewanella baltica OS183]|uniref:hypothetical protein n=1 Tax=Shewanella baltica TaxID=62322 RepID=UPI0001E1126C|nr:hypothetical protein [Shewanella baltica]AEG09678.1 hypothetical protein Sbal175_0383 [Shewanella baltica BA175]EHQ16805.1 hypothetical protein Sbal183_3938 [Shewanella baltica OS183]
MEFVNEYKALIASILVIAGWIFTIWNSNRTTKRTEVRAVCEDITKRCDEIASVSAKFWLDKDLGQNCQIYIMQLEGKLQFLEIRVNNLHVRTSTIFYDSMTSKISSLRHWATFNAEDFANIPEHVRNRNALQVNRLVINLVTDVEKVFEKYAG